MYEAKHNTVLDKSKAFAARIVAMYRYLQDTKREHTMSHQVLNSGTSIGANISEAVNGQSRKDFLSKMNIALKEASETEYWLTLLHNTGYLSETQYRSIHTDCIELVKLLTSIVKTTKYS